MKYNPKEIGKRIAERRRVLGLTQTDIANRLDFSAKQISTYESGKAIPPVNTLIKLCDILNCEFGYLMGDPDYSTPAKIEAAIRTEIGLNSDAMHSLADITRLERKYSYLENPPSDSINAINKFICSPYFAAFIENLEAVERHYLFYDKKVEEFEKKYGGGSFERALQWDFDLSQYVSEEESDPGISDKEYKEVEAVRPILDELRSNEYKLKIARYELQESFSILINQLYPKRETSLDY